VNHGDADVARQVTRAIESELFACRFDFVHAPTSLVSGRTVRRF
jgi:hypothetical protein